MCEGPWHQPRKSRKAAQGEVDVPVGSGDVTFVPEEWVFSDADGVLVLSQEQVAAGEPEP